MAQELAGDIKIDTVVYDIVRLFRLSNTKHGKSGLYKVPLTAAEILHKGIDEIDVYKRQVRRSSGGDSSS